MGDASAIARFAAVVLALCTLLMLIMLIGSPMYYIQWETTTTNDKGKNKCTKEVFVNMLYGYRRCNDACNDDCTDFIPWRAWAGGETVAVFTVSFVLNVLACLFGVPAVLLAFRTLLARERKNNVFPGGFSFSLETILLWGIFSLCCASSAMAVISATQFGVFLPQAIRADFATICDDPYRPAGACNTFWGSSSSPNPGKETLDGQISVTQKWEPSYGWMCTVSVPLFLMGFAALGLVFWWLKRNDDAYTMVPLEDYNAEFGEVSSDEEDRVQTSPAFFQDDGDGIRDLIPSAANAENF